MEKGNTAPLRKLARNNVDYYEALSFCVIKSCRYVRIIIIFAW